MSIEITVRLVQMSPMLDAIAAIKALLGGKVESDGS